MSKKPKAPIKTKTEFLAAVCEEFKENCKFALTDLFDDAFERAVEEKFETQFEVFAQMFEPRMYHEDGGILVLHGDGDEVGRVYLKDWAAQYAYGWEGTDEEALTYQRAKRAEMIKVLEKCIKILQTDPVKPKEEIYDKRA